MLKCTRTDTDTETKLVFEGGTSLDASNAPTLRPLLDELGETSKKNVVVDLGALLMIDSSGIGLLIALSKRLKTDNHSLRLINVGDQPRMVIKLLKLEAMLGVT
jgi:anti-anti-sigma factor